LIAHRWWMPTIHSRTRSHLVSEAKHSIVHVYGLNKLSQEGIKTQVKSLLENDRYICRATGRETLQGHFKAAEITEIIFRKYFAGIKMRGHADEGFFEAINEVFICLVASAIRHCLTFWETGVFIRSSKKMDFKYDTAYRTYQRLLETWKSYPANIQVLLLSSIKADLRARLVATQPKVQLESTEPLPLNDPVRFEQELRAELAGLRASARDAERRSAHQRRTLEQELEEGQGPTILRDVGDEGEE